MENSGQLFKIWYFFAIGFGLGKICWMPTGTIASVLAIPIWWGLVYFFSYQVYFIFIAISIGTGVYFCECANKFIGIHDDKSIVWDELVGMWITLIVVPIFSYFWVVVAFVLFRILDIVKPYPISWCDRNIQGGFGVMIDDMCAGIIAAYIIFISNRFFN